MKKLVFFMMGIFILTGTIVTANGIAQDGTPPEIKVGLVLDKSTYAPGDPINVTLSLANEDNVDIITSKGFSDTAFYLFLRFFDEQGNVIVSDKMSQATAISPPPPQVFPDEEGGLLQGEPVEFLAAKNPDGTSGWVASFEPFDALGFYPLANRSGKFTVKAVIPMSTYLEYLLTSSYVEYAPLDTVDWHGTLESNIAGFTLIGDADNDGYFYPEPPPGDPGPPDCDDTKAEVNPGAVEIAGNGIDDDCSPETPDVIVVNPGFITITAYKHTVGLGSHPGSTKEPMADLPVRVYDKKTGSCVSEFGVSWHHYKTIWLNCNSPDGYGITGSDGTVNFSMIPGDYIVIAQYDQDGSTESGDEVYFGAIVDDLASASTIQKHLKMMVKANGKKQKK